VPVSVLETTQGAITSSTTTVTIDVSGWSTTPTTGDFVVVLYRSYSGRLANSGSGIGATWANRYVTGSIGSLWIGSGATSKGVISITQNSAGIAQLTAYLVRGLANVTNVVGQIGTSSGALEFGPTAQSAGDGQIVFSWAVALDATLGTVTYPQTELPVGGWNYTTAISTSTQYARSAYRIPTGTATNHRLTAIGATGDNKQVFQAVISDYAAGPLALTDVTATAPADAYVETLSLNPLLVDDVTAAATADAHVETLALDVSLVDVTATATADAYVESVQVAGWVLDDVTAAATATAYVETVGFGTTLVDVPATAVATAYVETMFVDGETLATEFDETVVDDLVFVTVTAAEPLATSVPVMRQSYLMPELTEENPAWHARKDLDAVDPDGFYPVIEEAVGHVQLWIGHQNVTYIRGVETPIRRYDSELPWGDKTAMFEFPQMNPWEKPGEGDWAFLRRDADVLIGIVDEEGGAIRRLWGPGFLDARGSGLGEGEDYTHEAKGPMWALMHQIHEPVPYQPPIDIGVLIPRLINNSRGNRLNPMPRVNTGRMTRKRGARDQPLWRLIQDILAVDGWTSDGTAQWTIVIGDDQTPRLQLKKPLSTVDATFAFGNPNIETDLRFDYSTACDVVWARGIAPGGGAWAHMHYPGLELLTGLPYPNDDAGQFMNLGATDAGTDSGTGVSDWQRKARELGYTRLRVTGVMSSAWVDVVFVVQRALDITADGSIGPQTWTATFDTVDESIDLTPLRLPLARKPWAWETLHNAKGVVTGPNPDYDPTLIPREVALDLGPNVPKYPEGLNYARTYLAIHGEPKAFGTMTFYGCPDDVDRTRLRVGDNIECRGCEGETVVVQIGSMSTELDGPGGFVVSARVDNGRRDALTIKQLLSRDRDALADPARRPGNPNRSSRNVKDEGFVWDAESPCGVLPRMAVNGQTGLWSKKTIPFAEVGQLAGIVLEGTVPWAFAVFASLRMTPNILRGLMPGGPFASSDPWRPIMDTLEDDYGLIAAWGEQGDACGFSRGTERDGYDFSGLFREASTLEYVTETVPYVCVLAFMRGDAGFLEGQFEPARDTSG
jgi:hypothetical protein